MMHHGHRNGVGQLETPRLWSTIQQKARSRDSATSGSSYDEEFEREAIPFQPRKQERRQEKPTASSIAVASGNLPKKLIAQGRGGDNRFRKPPLEAEYVNVSSIRDMNANILPKRQRGTEKRGNKNGHLPRKPSRASRRTMEVRKGSEIVDTKVGIVSSDTKGRTNWRNYPKPWLQGISNYDAVMKAARGPEIGVGRKQTLPQIPPPPPPADFVMYNDVPSNNSMTLGPKTSLQRMVQSYEKKQSIDDLSYDGALNCRFNWKDQVRVPNLDLKQDPSSLSFPADTPVETDFDAILEQRMDQNPYSNALFYHNQQTTAPASTAYSAYTLETVTPRSPQTDDFQNETDFGMTVTSDGLTGSESELGSSRNTGSRSNQRRIQNLHVHFDASPSFGQINQRGSTYRLPTQNQNEEPISSRRVKPEQGFIRPRPPVATPSNLFIATHQPQAYASNMESRSYASNVPMEPRPYASKMSTEYRPYASSNMSMEPQPYASNIPMESATLPLYQLNYFPRPHEQIPVHSHRPSNTFLSSRDLQTRQSYSTLLPPGSHHSFCLPSLDRSSQSMFPSRESRLSQHQSQAFIPGAYSSDEPYSPLYSTRQRVNPQVDARMLLQAHSDQFFNGSHLDLDQQREAEFLEPPPFPYQPGPAYYASSPQLSSRIPSPPPPTQERMMPRPLIHVEQRPSWDGRIPLNTGGIWNGEVNQLRQQPQPVLIFHQPPTDINGNIYGPPSLQWLPYVHPPPPVNQSQKSLPLYTREYVDKHSFDAQAVPPQQKGESVHLQNPYAEMDTERSRGRLKKKKSSDLNNNSKKVAKGRRNVPALSKVDCGLGGQRDRRAESVPATPSRSHPVSFRDYKSSVGIHDELKMLEKLRQDMNTRRSYSADSSCASVRVLLSSCKVPIPPKKKVSDRVLANAKDYGHKFCPCYECRRANGLYVNHSLSITCTEQTDYVRKNIQDLKKYKLRSFNEPNVLVDTPKGDRNPQLAKFAGRKGYGKIPGYLFKRNQEIERERIIRKVEEKKLAEEKALAEIERQKQEELHRIFHKMERQRAAAKANFCMFKTELDPTKWSSLEGNTGSDYNCFLYMNGRVQSEILKLKGEGKMSGEGEAKDTNNNSIVKINLDSIKPRKKTVPEIQPGAVEPKPRSVSRSRKSDSKSKDDHQQHSKIPNSILEKTYGPKARASVPPGPTKKSVKKDHEGLPGKKDNEKFPRKTFGPEMSDGDIFDSLYQAPSYRRNISSAPGRILSPLINPHLVRVQSNFVFPELRYRLHPVNSTPNPQPMRAQEGKISRMFHSSLDRQIIQGLSDLQISDTVSESSDNATLLSLSREDLTQIGAGPIREDVRVSRKKLEGLILSERDMQLTGKGFIDTLMENTNTFIQWPSRMKIGAKTKKDLFVRVYGHDEADVGEAKQQILQELGPQRDLRITLKLEISYTDHSHLIGCRGATIRKVMDDTGCHIHFPDSNRMSKDHKSNQVTIAGGSIQAVEQARSRVRELSPLIFQFNLPVIQARFDMQMNPDAHNIFIDNIQTTYNVLVTVHPPNKLQQTTVSVKGCEVDSAQVKEAVGRIINYFASDMRMNKVLIESHMEITAVQHGFVRAVNDSNIHSIMMNTGAKIIFPDLSDGNIQQIKRSRIHITGELNSVYLARQQLVGCLPLRMIFDLSDQFPLDWEGVRQICTDLNVNVKMINRNRVGSGGPGSSLPPPVPGRSRTIQLVAAEKNAGNIFESRRRIMGGVEPPTIAKIPTTYVLRHVAPPGLVPFAGHLAPGGGPLPPLLFPSSPNPSMLSPVLSPSFWPPSLCPSPFCSPQFLYQPGHHEASMIGSGTLTAMGGLPHRARPYQGELQFDANNNTISDKGSQLSRPGSLKPNQYYHEMGAGSMTTNLPTLNVNGSPMGGGGSAQRNWHFQGEPQFDANNNAISDKEQQSHLARTGSMKPSQLFLGQ